jgi:peptide deformylase
VLRTAAEPVTAFDDALMDTVELMFASMYDARGVGLAANQIGLSVAVFVMDCQGVVAVVVNPRLVELADETQTEPEGCLSVLGRSYPTERAVMATVEGQHPNGKLIRLTGEGEVARCLQHETDHLNGKVYLDRLVGDVRRQARLDLS